MPVTTPKLKFDAVRSLGGEVVLHGDSYSDAYLHALKLQRSSTDLRSCIRSTTRT